MASGQAHDFKYFLDETQGNALMEKIAHGVHENHLRTFPRERQGQYVVMNSEVETVGIIGLTHCLQSARHSFRVAIPASLAYLGAAGQRVPCGLCPFNDGIYAHDEITLFQAFSGIS
jgi:hypothetical protein